MKVFIIFIVFLGPLIFFHELGHFLFARLFGVRVETFSLGFGPKLFRFKRNHTEYVLSLIPLGGYVKMFGDDPLNKDKISHADRKFSYNHKPVWARFWIVFGGPLANFFLAYFIFFGLLLNGERLPETRIGIITEKSIFYQAGLRSGDVIRSINGKAVEGPSDLDIETDLPITKMEVDRLGKMVPITINITPKDFFENLMASPPFLRKPIVIDSQGQVFFVSLDKANVNPQIALEQFADVSNNNELHFFKAKLDGEKHEPTNEYVQSFKLNYKNTNELLANLESKGFYPIDLSIRSITMNYPADKAGLKRNDIVLSLEGTKVYSFEEVRNLLEETKKEKEEVSLSYLGQGKIKTVKLKPQVQEIDGKQKKLIGVYSGGEYQEIRFVHTHARGLFEASYLAFGKTWDSFVKTASGFKKLITGEVSFKNVGGPIAIGKVASDSFDTSISYFFQIMALISVNLAIINLFPIPVLDGGHILFMVFEVINRGPLSRRKMEIAQQIGLSLLLLLMCAAIFNDVSRFF